MKADYTDEKDRSNKMFAKLHQTHKLIQETPHLHLQVLGVGDHHHYQSSEERPNGSSSIDYSRNDAPSNDGASIEVVRRPRGRPPGSKNKPKPPVVLSRDINETSMSPYVLELPGGVDIVDSITRFCRKRDMGLCVLSGWGTVANVTLRQPSMTPGPSVTFHGRFDILSISATVLPTSMASLAATVNGFTISLAGPQGQVVGGSVAAPLLSVGTVYVIAASFNNPSYHRIPVHEEAIASGSGGNESHHRQSPPAVSGGGGESGGHLQDAAVANSCGISSVYSCHMPAHEVIWAPIARQPPPY